MIHAYEVWQARNRVVKFLFSEEHLLELDYEVHCAKQDIYDSVAPAHMAVTEDGRYAPMGRTVEHYAERLWMIDRVARVKRRRLNERVQVYHEALARLLPMERKQVLRVKRLQNTSELDEAYRWHLLQTLGKFDRVLQEVRAAHKGSDEVDEAELADTY